MMRQLDSDDVARQATSSPSWNVVLRSLREASGVTQEGWATHLGYGRRTVQRWEHGDTPPDAEATEALVRLCAARGAYRTYRQGALAGMTISADLLRDLLSDARLSTGATQSRFFDGPAGQGGSSRAQLTPLRHHVMTQSHNLPEDLSTFVGRVRERADVARLIVANRLVTLIGSGGAGKTRLAIAVARDVMMSFGDGVWLAELAGLSDESLLLQTVALAVGARETRGRDLPDVLIENLRPRKTLLLLDNCEHLLNACAGLVARLLRECPHVQVLITSREPLGLPGESVWRVPSLALPDRDDVFTIDALARTEAVWLFVERARSNLPEFRLTEENAGSVARICRKLDGIPLAIELAAARASVLSPGEIDARLDDRFELLTSSGQGVTSRQQTMRASIDWSYALLDAEEQLLFDRLSVFPHDFTLAAVESVCADDMLRDVFNPLARLVDKSLVLADPLRHDQTTRYRLLDTLHVYGAERLAARGESERLQRDHARWFLDQAEQAGRAIHGPEQRDWLHWVDQEDANVRAALEWSLEHDETEIALRLCSALGWAWGAVGRATESRARFERTLAHPSSASYPLLRIRVSSFLGMMYLIGGDLVAAERLIDETVEAAERLGDDVSLLLLSIARAQIMQDSRDPEVSRATDHAMTLAKRLGDSWYSIRIIEVKARNALRRGDLAEASALLAEGVRLARSAGDVWSLAQILNNLGDVARSQGKHVEAGELYEESLNLRETLDIPGLTPSLRHNLGYVALAAGDPARALRFFRETMAEYARAGDRRGMAECLMGTAAVAAARGEDTNAARLFAAGTAALDKLGAWIWPANRADVARWEGLAQSRMGAAVFAEIYERAFTMSIEDAFDLAATQLQD